MLLAMALADFVIWHCTMHIHCDQYLRWKPYSPCIWLGLTTLCICNTTVSHTEIKNYFNSWHSDFLHSLSQAPMLWCMLLCIDVHWQIWHTNGSPWYRKKALQKTLVSTMAVRVSTDKKCTLHLCKCSKYRKIVRTDLDLVQWNVKLQSDGNDVMFFDLTKQEPSKIKISLTGRRNTTQTVWFDGSYVTD
jgi:hypothetical protein